jgi:hypothetical protein
VWAAPFLGAAHTYVLAKVFDPGKTVPPVTNGYGGHSCYI